MSFSLRALNLLSASRFFLLLKREEIRNRFKFEVRQMGLGHRPHLESYNQDVFSGGH